MIPFLDYEISCFFFEPERSLSLKLTRIQTRKRPDSRATHAFVNVIEPLHNRSDKTWVARISNSNQNVANETIATDTFDRGGRKYLAKLGIIQNDQF